MGIFKRKKTQSNEPVSIENTVFGKMRNFGNWFTVDSFDVVLWKQIYSVRMRTVAKGVHDPVTVQQEKACLEFKKNLEMYQSQIEEAVSNLFDIHDEETLKEHIQVCGVYFSKDGKFGVAMSTTFDNDFLEECGIGPDENFGIALYPELFILTSNESFLEYYA